LEGIIATPEYQAAAKVVQETSETYHMENIPQQQSRWRLKESSPKKLIVAAKDDPQSQSAMYDPLISIYHLVKERQEKSRRGTIYTDDAVVPELSISENPKPIILNNNTSSNEKSPTKEEKQPVSRRNSPLVSIHIKFTASTKAHDPEKIGSPATSISTTNTNEKRTSKRLSNLFQSKRFSKDFKEQQPSDGSLLSNNVPSSENLSKRNHPERNSKTPPVASSRFPTPTPSMSTPVKRTSFQQNVNSLGRRLTFKPTSSKETTAQLQSSIPPSQQPKKPDIPRPRTTSPSPSRSEAKSTSKSLRLDTRKARNAISGALNGPMSPKKSGDSSGMFKYRALCRSDK
jgi:hypothetical protein